MTALPNWMRPPRVDGHLLVTTAGYDPNAPTGIYRQELQASRPFPLKLDLRALLPG